MVMDDELTAVDIFDPLGPRDQRKTLPALPEQPMSFSPPSIYTEIYRTPKPVTPVPPSLFPYPVKLRLKQRPYPEMKQFSQFLQQIVDEQQSKQVELARFRLISEAETRTPNDLSLPSCLDIE